MLAGMTVADRPKTLFAAEALNMTLLDASPDAGVPFPKALPDPAKTPVATLPLADVR